MKTLIALIGITALTASTGHCKPGGWLLDLAKNSNVQVNVGTQPVYYQQTPVYYQQPQVYYRPSPVIYQQPSAIVYYTEPVYRQAPPVYYTRPYHRCR